MTNTNPNDSQVEETTQAAIEVAPAHEEVNREETTGEETQAPQVSAEAVEENPAPEEKAAENPAAEVSAEAAEETAASDVVDASSSQVPASEEAVSEASAAASDAVDVSSSQVPAGEEAVSEAPAATSAEAVSAVTSEEAVSEAPAATSQEAVSEAPVQASDDDEETKEDASGKSFEELLEQYDQFRTYRPGDIVTGTIVSMGEQEVLVDIGARVEGMIPTTELRNEDGTFMVNDGEQITVMVCRFNPDAQYIPLSFERARVSRVWDEIEDIAEKEKVTKGTIIEKVKGGFIVDVGVRAFLPTSQATLKPQKDYQDLLGKVLEFGIIKIQRRRGNLILSRRDILQSEFEESKKGLFEKLVEGAELLGVVKNITDYGVFMDLGGLDGLLHITDMSWGRVTHPKDLVELGDELTVKVLRFDREKEKVSLGLKQCTPDPWLSVSEKYPPGDITKGKVLNLTSYGSFVELEPGVEGMIHVSELSWTKKIRNPAQLLNKGQEVSVRVLDLDSENRRVSLSLKQTEDNPWDSLSRRFPVGSKVNGKVRNITDFGAFVEIEDGIDGLVHISDFSWGERNATPSEFVKKGEDVEVVILAVDTENHKVSLGMKQLNNDPWIDFTNKFKVNATVDAPVSKVTDFGVFVQLSEHVEGLVRNAELEKDNKFEVGQVIKAIITRITHRERKVDLSIRKLHQHEERQAVLEYSRGTQNTGATMGDIMGNELKKLMNK